MATAIECFMLHETRRAQRWLRRYAESVDPMNNCRHDHWVFFDQVVTETLRTEQFSVAHDNPRWPKDCAKCGYRFDNDDPWAVTPRRIYTYGRDGERQCALLDPPPPGAMWYADWMQPDKPKQTDLYVGPDGRCLVVQTPGGSWFIDGPTTNDGNRKAWTREGNPPLISVTPQIVIGGFKGKLSVGRLIPIRDAKAAT